MDNAADLFGGANLNGAGELLGYNHTWMLMIRLSTTGNPLEMACRTKEDFSALATALADSLIVKHGSSKFFGGFVDDLARALVAPIKSDEVGKVRASMAGIAMDKQKLEKSGGKVGPKGKPTAQVIARGREDLSSFGEVLDDDVAAAEFNEDEDFVRVREPVAFSLALLLTCPSLFLVDVSG